LTGPSSTGTLTHGFLFADLRGYTAYAEQWGDAAAADLLDRYRVLIRDVVARTDGAEIRTEGDSFYVVFPSASRAVAAGLAIVAAAHEGTTADPAHPIRVGVGIHAGEAEERPDGYVGSAVNLAARVCSVAQPGEVLVTDTVRVLTRTSGHYRFTPRGKPTLKGIGEPIALFRVDPIGEAATGAQPRTLPRVRVVGVGGLMLVGVLALVGVTIVARGSSGATPPPGSPTAAGGAAARGTAASSVTTGSSPLPLIGGPNQPGTHCSATFTPTICLTLPKGWSVVSELASEILISDDTAVLDSYQGGIRAAELGAHWKSITISRPSFSVVPCSNYQPAGPGSLRAPDTVPVGSTREAFVAQLRDRPGLQVSAPVPSQLGANDAFVADVSLIRSCGPVPIVYLDWFGPCTCPDGLPSYAGFAAVTGATSRLFVLDHQNQTIVLAATAPTSAFPAYVEGAKAILSSLTFAP
jgi:class 3 adenylate cyclase